MEFTEPFDVPVVDAHHAAEAVGPNRTSLPSALPPGEFAVTVCVTPRSSSFGIPVDLGGDRDCGERQPDDGHDRDHRVALALVLDHPPERERQRERDEQDGVELEEVADARRVRERVRGVDVEEVAAVRAQLLDRLLARVRAARDLLRGAGDRVHVGEAVRVLDDPGRRSARSRTRRRAAGGCGRSCARGRPRSCRSCAARRGRAPGSAPPSPPCPRRPTRTAAR